MQWFGTLSKPFRMRTFWVLILTVCGISAAFWALTWKSPSINWDYKKEIHRCIHESNPDTLFLPSGSGLFEIHFVKQAGTDCVNPHFPSIHIKTTAPHNAWIQIVHTDTNDTDYKHFVDSIPDRDYFPLYSKEEDFYDAPIWLYTLFSKPVHNWKGHAYAIQFDPHSKTITCIGGISWGYTLSPLRLRPQMTLPQSLFLEDWKKDCNLVKVHLKDYIIKDTF